MSPPSTATTPSQELPSGWLSYFPTIIKSINKSLDEEDSSDDDEPFDLSDEELDATEAYDLMLGLPKELCLNPPSSPPPKTIMAPPSAVKSETTKRNDTVALSTGLALPKPVVFSDKLPKTQQEESVSLFQRFMPNKPDLKRWFTTSPPAVDLELPMPTRSPPSPIQTRISSDSSSTLSPPASPLLACAHIPFSKLEAKLSHHHLLDLSFKKLRAVNKQKRRPLSQTLKIHLTIQNIRTIRSLIKPTLPSRITRSRPSPKRKSAESNNTINNQWIIPDVLLSSVSPPPKAKCRDCKESKQLELSLPLYFLKTNEESLFSHGLLAKHPSNPIAITAPPAAVSAW